MLNLFLHFWCKYSFHFFWLIMRRSIRRKLQRIKHNKSAVKTLVVLFVFGSLPFWFLFCNFLLRFITAITIDQVPVWHKPVIGNTSIAFYISTKANDDATPDLRTRFWEDQLKEFTGEHDRIYVSDEYSIVNGYELVNFSKISNSFCNQFHGSLKLFLTNQPQFKWFFFTNYKTYVNLTNLVEVIKTHEANSDPMSHEIVTAGSYDKKTPFLESGILLSNYAAKKAINSEFSTECYQQCLEGDQSEYIRNIVSNLTTKWYTDRFGLGWPSGSNDIIKKKEYFKLQKCSKNVKPMYSYIGISMSGVDIKESKKMIKKYQSNLAITRESGHNSFCKIVPIIK